MSLDISRQSNSSVIIDIEDEPSTITNSLVNTHTTENEQSLFVDRKEKPNERQPDPKSKEIKIVNEQVNKTSGDVTSQASDKTKTQTAYVTSQNTNNDKYKKGLSYRRLRKRRRVEMKKSSISSKSSSSEEGEIPATQSDTSKVPSQHTQPTHPPPAYHQIAKDDDEETCVKGVFVEDEKDISMEDGQLNESREEDYWDLSSVTDLLKAFHSLRKKVTEMEETKDQPCHRQLKDTVTKVVKEVLHEFKREIIMDIKKEINLESVQTDIKKCAQIMNSTKQWVSRRLTRLVVEATI